MSFHWPLSIPQYTQKISTHYSNKRLSKNGVNIKFSPPRFFFFFLPFFSQSWTLWQLFFLNSFCLNIKHIFFCHSMDNYLRDIPLHFRVNGWILSREIRFFLERINLQSPSNLFLTHTQRFEYATISMVWKWQISHKIWPHHEKEREILILLW